MPLVDEECALTSPTSPTDALREVNEIGSSSISSGLTIQNESTSQQQQQQQPPTPNLTDQIPGAQGFHRHSEAGQKKIQKSPPKPRLLHPILHRVPMHLRFGLNGFLSNVLFMVAYNQAVVTFEKSVSSSTLYATVYLIFIPISHAIISLLVFGWPEHYVRSLMSNAPVGLTAIVLGAALTAYLDEIEFNVWVADAAMQYRNMLGYTIDSAGTAGGKPTTMQTPPVQNEASRGGGEFYSSLFVLIVTGIWTFVLSVMVNAPAESLEKKEL
eukprot:CAMPEP_0197176982 /NCGR_PEP_ID=MMETSP1423-20130617/2746_1 /TAXON_ID=476441 /ORGANISM="Pseudo-nitzschia heimii, Strain UNC1101" /LENGTH=269 /DNA_ID=CAMNT_0042626451 /DNA_START=181 /DNA_END=990 /DNA_ORIENTATION=-